MLNIFIKYNKKSYNWVIYIDKHLFLTLFIKNKINKKYSIIFSYYLILLKILRQFGLIKGIKNLNNFK